MILTPLPIPPRLALGGVPSPFGILRWVLAAGQAERRVRVERAMNVGVSSERLLRPLPWLWAGRMRVASVSFQSEYADLCQADHGVVECSHTATL